MPAETPGEADELAMTTTTTSTTTSTTTVNMTYEMLPEVQHKEALSGRFGGSLGEGLEHDLFVFLF